MNRRVTFALALALILLGGGGLALIRSHQKMGKPGVKVVAVPSVGEDGKPISDHSVFLPEKILDFASIAVPVSQVECATLPKDTTFGRRIYTNSAGFAFQTSVVLMGRDRTSIHKPQFCLIGQGWNIDNEEIVPVRIERPHPYELPVMKLTLSQRQIDNSGRTTVRAGLYVYWFVAENHLTAEHGKRMWSMLQELLNRGVLERWAYTSYFTECAPGGENEAFEKLKSVIQTAVPEFQTAVGAQIGG